MTLKRGRYSNCHPPWTHGGHLYSMFRYRRRSERSRSNPVLEVEEMMQDGGQLFLCPPRKTPRDRWSVLSRTASELAPLVESPLIAVPLGFWIDGNSLDSSPTHSFLYKLQCARPREGKSASLLVQDAPQVRRIKKSHVSVLLKQQKSAQGILMLMLP